MCYLCTVSEEEGLRHVQNELEAKITAQLGIVKYVSFVFFEIPYFHFINLQFFFMV
jgi:hypothetical protein